MTLTQIKRIPIKEFRELGYLQEMNRQFLHPLGLAMEIIVNDDGTETLGGVWDYREDPEGIRFAYADKEMTSMERLEQAEKKAEYIRQEQNSRRPSREEALGFWIEPLGDKL